MPEKSGGLTLTKLNKIGRVAVKWTVIGLVTLMVGRVSLASFVAFYTAMNPPPPPAPTQGFGALPPVAFPTQTADERPTSYKLETATGALPSFGDRATVYLTTKNSPNLLDIENARITARSYGFTDEPEQINNRTYRWRSTGNLNATFEYDIVDGNFTYETDYLARPELLLDAELPSNYDAVQQLKNFLSKAALLPADAATASGKTTYLKAIGGVLKPAVSISDADFIAVDLNRIQLNNETADIYTPDGETGTIHAIVGGGKQSGILKAVRTYYPIDYTQTETYPLRTVTSAWQKLQAGEGYVANKGTANQAVVRQVVLGYFEGYEYQTYVQPIYVFTGDNGFIGYVSAIDPSAVAAAATTK